LKTSKNMHKSRIFLLTISLLLLVVVVFLFAKSKGSPGDEFVSFIVNPKAQDLRLYWKDGNQQNFVSIENLRVWLAKNHQKLVFAMNGGMYKKDNTPVGLFIENQKILMPLDTSNGEGNFYLKPNGVFYITTDNVPFVCRSSEFCNKNNVKYATQSGPMLVIDGQIHPVFKINSTSLNIRNGVGILPDNKILFAMSKKEINFYDFANYFKKMGCVNALYLDGLVSRTYLPEQNWVQIDGNFGVIIGVSSVE
jgi:uncharacterized protein YigE (DUF2233 family)